MKQNRKRARARTNTQLKHYFWNAEFKAKLVKANIQMSFHQNNIETFDLFCSCQFSFYF